MGEGNQMALNLRRIIFSTLRKLLFIALPIIIIFVLLVGISYSLKMLDGKQKDGDSSNTSYAVATYTSSTTLNEEDDSITTSMSAQELWDELIANGSRVDEYLSDASELARLMNAQLVTQYMDIRDESEIDEDIDWDSIYSDVDSTSVQGIIKMKRADNDGNTTTMTYVDNETFYTWLEGYSINGDEETKNNLLTHFTLSSSSNSNTTENITVTDVTTDISQAILDATESVGYQGSRILSKMG